MPEAVALPTPPEPCAAGALEAAVGAALGVPSEHVRATSAALPAVLGTLPEGAHVAVSEPTDPSTLEAIVAAGLRYVDAGRDHRFRVHPEGWRFVLAGARLAILGSPNEPTGTIPERRRLEEAAGVPLLLDQRYAPDPLAPLRLATLTWRTLGLVAPGAPELIVGSPEVLAPLRLPDPDPLACGLGLAVVTTPAPFRARMASWVTQTRQLAWALAARGDLVVTPPRGLGVWTRVPGIPSAQAAHEPRATGSAHWTWRDGVRWS